MSNACWVWVSKACRVWLLKACRVYGCRMHVGMGVEGL